MNRNQALAAAALVLFGSSAFAGDEFNPQTGFANDGVGKALTSEQVRAETQAARKNGPLNVTRDDLMFANDKKGPGLTRAEVVAELQRSRAQGEVLGFDQGDFFARNQVKSTLTREQVREQTRTALRASRQNGS